MKKACRKDKIFYEGSECPICKSNQPASSWQGRLYILDKEKSTISKKIGIALEGEYAIKVR
ncbi:DNA-directed RNA polymerase subunit E'' [Candidatus Woesearchaeota archaeon]|nr:DNA-directed RNA polymerase subunit E'' [Candidatus Woesearchaeota archaeon]